MDQISKESFFKPYCIGIVALDKKLYEDKIELMPIEDTALLDGDLSDKWEEIDIKGKDGEIQDYQNKAKYTKTIEATWLALHQANRLTSPDVRRGDKVQVYRLGDSNVFYWDVLDNYTKIRRLETVVYGYSATKTEDVYMNPDNTYVQGVSTQEKLVTLIYTSKDPSNGEKYRYGIFIDTKNNHIVIKDDVENRIVIQSDPKLIRLETTDNGFIQIDGTRITSKGKWYHRGPITVEENIHCRQQIHALDEVIAKDIGLTTHLNPPAGPPADWQKAIAPWDPHPDELKVDYRNPELLK